jgi:hypothetical protein
MGNGALSPSVNLSGLEAHNSPLFSAEVKNASSWPYRYSRICFYSVVLNAVQRQAHPYILLINTNVIFIYEYIHKINISYNVGVTWSVLNPNCTRYSNEDAVRIVNFFIYNPNHTSLQSLTIIYHAATRLHNYNHYTFVTTVTYSTLARIHSLLALHSNLCCTIARKVP